MKQYTIYQIDAFTQLKFRGNPAGVVVNAEGLSETQMQLIARELNNSETAFLLPSNDNSCDGVIRYFTPTTEVPICGHATIAAMYAKAFEENLDSCVLRIKTKVGILPFEIIKNQNNYKVIMTQGRIEIDLPLSETNRNILLDSLSLTIKDLDPRCPVQIASTGHSKVMIGITKKETLNNLKPNLTKLAELSNTINCQGYYVFTLDSNDDDILVHGRMFAPSIGINEDPVTGNANGPLGAYLVENNIVSPQNNTFQFKAKQGKKMHREGIVEVIVTIESNKPEQVQIIGDAVIVFKTIIEM